MRHYGSAAALQGNCSGTRSISRLPEFPSGHQVIDDDKFILAQGRVAYQD
jgi:hypothetical protein